MLYPGQVIKVGEEFGEISSIDSETCLTLKAPLTKFGTTVTMTDCSGVFDKVKSLFTKNYEPENDYLDKMVKGPRKFEVEG